MRELFFLEQGNGPALIFLHGFCETHEIWTDFIKPFTNSFRVITLDLPGFGDSDSLPSPFTIDDVGDTVAAALIKNNVKEAVIIGHSLGGYVGLSLAQHHPKLVTALGLFHSSAFSDSEEKKENRNKVIDSIKKYGALPFIDTFVPGLFFDKSNIAMNKVYKIAAQTKSEILIGYTAAMRDRPDRRLFWAKSGVNKLLIAGTEDTSIPIQISREMGKTGSNLTFHEIKNIGHMGFFEAERECQLAITSFTDDLFSNN